MSRVARVVVPGYPHHVTQRGNRRADIFESDDDRHAYLRFLKKYCTRRGLDVWAYCLMSNHVHLVVVPQTEAALGEALRDAHTVYAMYFNRRTQLSGHVWQGRFYSCPLDDAHLWAAVRYTELNPVRAGLVDRAEAYPWSSAPAHCAHTGTDPSERSETSVPGTDPSERSETSVPGTDPSERSETGLSLIHKRGGTGLSLFHNTLLSPDFPPPGVISDWSAWLAQASDPDADERLRQRTHTGRPCGSERFFELLEHQLQRMLRPRKPGPKRKDINA